MMLRLALHLGCICYELIFIFLELCFLFPPHYFPADDELGKNKKSSNALLILAYMTFLFLIILFFSLLLSQIKKIYKKVNHFPFVNKNII